MSLLDDLRAYLGTFHEPLQNAVPNAGGALQATGQGLINGLSTVGNIVDTPASLGRGLGTAAGTALRGDDGGEFMRRAFSGVWNPGERVTGADINANAGILGGGESTAGNIATTLLTDPLTVQSGARLVGGAAQGAGRALRQILPEAEGAGARSTADLLPLRRNISVVRDVGLNAEGSPTYSRTVGDASPFLSQNAAEDLAQHAGRVQGQYNPNTQIASIIEGAQPGTVRHEVFHGLMDQARNTGNNSGLGFLARASNAGQQSGIPLLRGLGQMGEEALATGVGQSRSALGQLQGAWNFLDNPLPEYGQFFSQYGSPLAGRIYQNSVIPTAVRTAGTGLGGAAAGGTATYLSSLLNGSE